MSVHRGSTLAVSVSSWKKASTCPPNPWRRICQPEYPGAGLPPRATASWAPLFDELLRERHALFCDLQGVSAFPLVEDLPGRAPRCLVAVITLEVDLGTQAPCGLSDPSDEVLDLLGEALRQDRGCDPPGRAAPGRPSQRSQRRASYWTRRNARADAAGCGGPLRGSLRPVSSGSLLPRCSRPLPDFLPGHHPRTSGLRPPVPDVARRCTLPIEAGLVDQPPQVGEALHGVTGRVIENAAV